MICYFPVRPTIDHHPDDLIIEEGKRARFNCDFRGVQDPRIIWHHDGYADM